MFNKKKKIIEELKLKNDEIIEELNQIESSFSALHISYNLLEEKYKIACKERDEYKAKLDGIKEKNRQRQIKYRERKAGK